ncbi:Uncharacterized protein conserved in bacteria [Proteus mirabilis]|uniref:Uncharacterized protein conserved in bacteria n=1 Tax=Proteus mirabilis TaxID=584 RepID=A0A379GJZ8_PROMI|nr:Uncharacterized protein conserved in bacteria [Proteus mirabilis]
MSEPIPVDGVSLRHELAYGGTWQSPQQEQQQVIENPIGMGFYPDVEALDKQKRYPAPQIMERYS